jgi:hypothetical protein
MATMTMVPVQQTKVSQQKFAERTRMMVHQRTLHPQYTRRRRMQGVRLAQQALGMLVVLGALAFMVNG